MIIICGCNEIINGMMWVGLVVGIIYLLTLIPEGYREFMKGYKGEK